MIISRVIFRSDPVLRELFCFHKQLLNKCWKIQIIFLSFKPNRTFICAYFLFFKMSRGSRIYRLSFETCISIAPANDGNAEALIMILFVQHKR